jgi:hypothetical protein
VRVYIRFFILSCGEGGGAHLTHLGTGRILQPYKPHKRKIGLYGRVVGRVGKEGLPCMLGLSIVRGEGAEVGRLPRTEASVMSAIGDVQMPPNSQCTNQHSHCRLSKTTGGHTPTMGNITDRTRYDPTTTMGMPNRQWVLFVPTNQVASYGA